MRYSDALSYLNSFINYEKLNRWPYRRSLKLDRFRAFLNSLGDPHKQLPIVHVAGSKGKGSTCAYIAYMLRAAGYRAGLYTSPHLSDVRERIRILEPGSPGRDDDFEGMISRRALAAEVARLKPAVDRFNRTSRFGALSFFEVYTAVAFSYFARQKVECCVLETGLGGRLDATNVCDSLVAVITPISLEHTDKLGKTIPAIAKEKAGIIKTFGQSVVLSPQGASPLGTPLKGTPLAQKEIEKRCKAYSCRLTVVQPSAARGLPRLQLPGAHQRHNAATAVAAVKQLAEYGFRVPAAAMRRGLAGCRWPGRCEIVHRRPTVILDGCQNRASAAALAAAVRALLHAPQRLILILGASQDKDIRGMCEELLPLAHAAIATAADNPRAAAPAAIAAHLRMAPGLKGSGRCFASCRAPGPKGSGRCSSSCRGVPFRGVPFRGVPISCAGSVREALRQAMRLASPRDAILVAGSLFLVAEARRYLKHAY